MALAAVAISRVDANQYVPLTMYVPLRDGPGEAGVVGMFADWRNILINTDISTATVLGVILEVAQTLRTRRWAMFNALKKPEATVVNFSPMDAAGTRAGFIQIHEDQWRQGDRLGRHDVRGTEMGKVVQPRALNIEERDRDHWMLHINMAIDVHPPSWVQRFVRAFKASLLDAVERPLTRVHAKSQTEW